MLIFIKYILLQFNKIPVYKTNLTSYVKNSIKLSRDNISRILGNFKIGCKKKKKTVIGNISL